MCSSLFFFLFLNKLRFASKTSSRHGHKGKRKQKGKRQAFLSPILIITPTKLSLAKAVQAQYYLEEDRLVIPEKRFLSTSRASISV